MVVSYKRSKYALELVMLLSAALLGEYSETISLVLLITKYFSGLSEYSGGYMK